MRAKQWIAGGLAALLLFSAGCGKGGKPPEETDGPVITGEEEEIDDPNILTHVYREEVKTAQKVQIDFLMVTPYYDRETQVMTYVTKVSEDRSGEEERYSYAVRTLDAGGGEEELASFTLTGEWLSHGFLDAEGLTCCLYRQDENGNRTASIGRYDLATGEWTRTGDILGLFNSRARAIQGLIRDPSGNLIVGNPDGSEILVLSPEGERISTILTNNTGGMLSNLVVSENGRVFACFFGNGYSAAEVFPETGTIGGAASVPNGIVGGSEGYLYYYTDQEGIHGRPENGSGDRLVLNYLNSGMTWLGITPLYISRDIVYVLDRGGMVANAFDGAFLCRYILGDNIDLREQQVITLAYFGYLTTSMTSAINSFNRDHPEARIVATDWSEYNTQENGMGGYEKLSRDLLTGTAKPDILVGGYREQHMMTALEHNLYRDLTPFLAADDTVNASNLFGCVKRLFDDGHGGMWGITPNFMLNAFLYSTPELLGRFAEQGYWDIEEVLDYIDALPEDRTFLLDLTKNGVPLLDHGGYMEFVDREAGTCSFDSPLFVRYLHFADSLPTQDEYRMRSPYADMGGEDLALARMEGKIAVASSLKVNGGYINDIDTVRRLMMTYSTKDWTVVGYPAPVRRPGAGITASTRFAAVITSYCENPDLAWDLVRRCFSSDEGQGGIPALRSTFDGAVERWYGRQFEDYYVLHDYISTLNDPEHAITEDDLLYPGILSTFEESDRDKYAALFDTAGVTAAEGGVDAIYSILYEEMSAFFGGIGTAEDCAKKIQSRVSIWLAENR